MKFRNKSFWLAIALIFFFINGRSQTSLKRNNLFDAGWRFHRGGAQYAENPAFDDSGWRILDLPHDWSIEDLPGTNSPFNMEAISQASGGFTTGGTGWYRKTFKIPHELKDKNSIIMFEGVYMNADIWLNGELLGKHPYGYTSFWYDITGKMKSDKENVLAVKVNNEGENSRWYSGSGIYRHVWLQLIPPVHVATWGTYITTPRISEKEAQVNIKTSIENNSKKVLKIKLVTKIINNNSLEQSEVESEKVIDPGTTIEIAQEIKINNPSLWSTETPVLYNAVSEIYESDSLVDQSESKFGIRSISFDTVNGFQLNGKPMKLKGGCVHHDNGILGSKAYDRAEERRVEILKTSGFNAVRSAHNPPSPAFLDACDKLGMLVIDESFDMWKDEKNPFDYHLYFTDWWKKDLESMIQRDRNHPSVIIWSIGNEIPNRHKPEVVEMAKLLADYVRLIEPTRPVTSAVNSFKTDQDPFFATLDIAGYNYASRGNQNNTYETDHKRVPERMIINLESFPMEAFSSWMDVIDHPYVIGDFVWTAFDYIGEASIGWRGYPQKQDFFPWNLAYCGDIDICGFKCPPSYYRDALWKENSLSIWVTPLKPTFALKSSSKWSWTDPADDWNWEAGGAGYTMEVIVYSSCEQVELFLNGKSLGKKTTNRSTQYFAGWKVPFEPGTLRAVGLVGKSQVNIKELHSAGTPSRIKLTADRNKIHANSQDLSYVTVELVDNNGIRNPKADNLIKFEIEGPGTIAGVGNANPVSTESYQLPERKAWHGRCIVIIKSGNTGGKILLKSTAVNMNTSSIEIESY